MGLTAPSGKEAAVGVSLRNKQLRQFLGALPWLVPQLVGLVLYSAGPIAAAFLMSFTQWNIITPPKWVGLHNYTDLVDNPLFWKVLRNTFYFPLVSVPLGAFVALLAALALNQKVKGMTFFRTLYFLPVVSSTVAVALVWSWIYNPEFGLLNWFLRTVFNIQGPAWLADQYWAMPALIIMSVWKGLGYNMMIFLAGLQGIPQELYEAATVDGASRRHLFRHITVPLLSPTTFFVLVMGTIGSFQVFEMVFVMTKGGPAYSTLTLSYWIFQNAFQFFHMGTAAAQAFVLFAFVLLLTLLQLYYQRRWVHYG